MMDNTIDYQKILNAINQSLDIIKNEDIGEDMLQPYIDAQQTVMQAMNFSISNSIK
ncbi:hypothetical protein ABER75_14930 [Niallia taxi]|uniref:hypothetical protein n=1 Tax=Niallia taxi TaxID=2499688 RepID=UPI0013E328C4|nr:hypothetical protein [Niallia taxi]MCM3215586.1 hypothetical protein [Niallia taxi]MDK8639890.1 hypothetical protein [Niallia taxi]MED4040487.1 hypothetical protein [Niallia taxi]MED4055330.1 hypothetical protein [Niallia taxi]MED4117521.1 hypothetical protein [Niallia taxi]